MTAAIFKSVTDLCTGSTGADFEAARTGVTGRTWTAGIADTVWPVTDVYALREYPRLSRGAQLCGRTAMGALVIAGGHSTGVRTAGDDFADRWGFV